jgi:acyl-CoA synthetase (AMP-forming)/AMP-acid ligase II
LSYHDLEKQSNQCASGLRHYGVESGTRVVMMVRPGIEFMTISFALAKLGAIAVFVDPRMGRQNVNRSLAEVRPDGFIGSLQAHIARVALGWARDSARLCINVSSVRIPRALNYEEVLRRGQPTRLSDSGLVDLDQPAAVVFTSGSTGVPKGVVYTHRMFSAQAALLADHFGIQPGEVDLTTFPLFALFNPALRMTTVFPDIDFTRPGKADPGAIVRCVQRHSATHMFGSPALLDRLAEYGQRTGVKLPTMRRVLVAGAPVSMKTLIALNNLLGPEAETQSCYGATEALPMCSISGRHLLEETQAHPEKGACLGPPIKGTSLAVIKVVDGPIQVWSDDLVIKSGEVGELVVSGANVSCTYWNRHENELTKLTAPRDTILHRTGDLGYIDDRGYVWFCGRKSQRVITPSDTLYTVPCERVFDQHPSVSRSALVGVGKPPNQRPVLCVELGNGSQRKEARQIQHELIKLAERYPHLRQIETILFHSCFPVDARHNAKIIREKLSIWAAKRIS